MDMTKEGNYKLEDWSLKDVECTGKGWEKKHRPCYSLFTLYDGDIVKRATYDDMCYGFICDKCHIFTELDERLIPSEIKEFCPQVAAPGSDAYSKLSDEEKELSKYL